MSQKLKKVVFFLNIIVSLLLLRAFGNIVHDRVQNHDRRLSVKKIRKLEKLYVKLDKAILDINFLNNFKTFGVVLKFLYFDLTATSCSDAKAIRTRLLKSAIRKRVKEKRSIQCEIDKEVKQIRIVVTGIEWFTIFK